MQCGSLALAYVEDAIRAHLSLRLAQPEQPAAKRVRCGWDFANDRPIMRDELPGESQSAQPAVDAEWLEEIAQQWDGCIYDAGPGGNIDIGQSIREAWERRSALTHLRARPAAQALSDEQIAVRGRFDVAVALLRECLGPLEVSAAIIESDDGEPMEALIRRVKTFVSAASAPEEPAEPVPAQPKRSDPKNCTARVNCDNGIITTRSCTTQRPLIDKGGSSDGERDYYECPDCGKSITIDYREN
jgi:hypothetical protein